MRRALILLGGGLHVRFSGAAASRWVPDLTGHSARAEKDVTTCWTVVEIRVR
jgi:hypothetical protein